jgi:hypothetical protein
MKNGKSTDLSLDFLVYCSIFLVSCFLKISQNLKILNYNRLVFNDEKKPDQIRFVGFW